MNLKIQLELLNFITYTDKVIAKRGIDIYKSLSKTDIVKLDKHEIIMSVASSEGGYYYIVEIEFSTSKSEILASCDCPYAENEHDTCKHQIAVAKYWVESIKNERNELKSNQKITIQPYKQYLYTLPFINNENITQYATQSLLRRIYFYSTEYKHYIITITNDGKDWAANVKNKYFPFVKWQSVNEFAIGCNCGKNTPSNLCEHELNLLYKIENEKDKYYFKQFEDQAKQKEVLLAQIGLAIDSKLATQIEFGYDYTGKLKIGKLPPNFITHTNAIKKGMATIFPHNELLIDPTTLVYKATDTVINLGLLINCSVQNYQFFRIEMIGIEQKVATQVVKKYTIDEAIRLDEYKLLSEPIQELFKNFTNEALRNEFVRNNIYNHYYNSQVQANINTSRDFEIIKKYVHQNLMSCINELELLPTIYILPKGEKFGKTSIVKKEISSVIPKLHFNLKNENELQVLELFTTINSVTYDIESISIIEFFICIDTVLYLLSQNDYMVIKLFENGNLFSPITNQQNFLEDVVLPLAKKYTVQIPNVANIYIKGVLPSCAVYLSELNDFLIIKLKWHYSDHIVETWHEADTILQTPTLQTHIQRNKVVELEQIEIVQNLHPSFINQNRHYFYLPFAECLKKGWFINFVVQLKANGITVFGANDLKKLKINTATPKVVVSSNNSELDWFDLHIEITYNDIVVPLSELKKALINKQEYILLSDGSMGMLPEEWITKFKTLLHIGDVKQNDIKISKINFTLLDSLYENIDTEALQQELMAKKEALKNFEENKKYILPKSIKATLRNYQKSGFQWLSTLQEMQWGGCLADDMGLGKTLQTITFLQSQIDNKKFPHLIVCPTSLIYNWQAELVKFAPKITYTIHYGALRNTEDLKKDKSHIIITSYGHLRSDIEAFAKVKFDYAVLDESQAIKNPVAQITKAVQLIKAKNKLILSGTPVQNNTFDLYAQMNFLNPGMLGSQDYFKTEFANPIDKNSDKEKVAELQKMIYPFFLRRTKEIVAKDLPDKTETILWCEMEKAQRKIYTTFKEHYRNILLGKIEEVGLEKSSFVVLEALLKLRQICNSPAILNEDVQYPNESIKLQEITREIVENVGKHKVLIFSQFTSMLHLIENVLKTENVNYLYLDGSTKAKDRKGLVDQFQNDSSISVFLISLKAGGVGLNLTAADYVYLVDPWWNPAVEAQAIDRTHRIGQTNKVFAYKMICKDTIEEKILLLQEKKKTLSKELISNESGFIKKLTKSDIEYLFT